MDNYFTIDGFENLSSQEVFDMALAHVRKTGKKSFEEVVRSCEYGGIGCAASPFLKDEYKDIADKTGQWRGLFNAKLVPLKHLELVSSIQTCHDDADSTKFLTDFENRMKDVANEYTLNYEKS